MAAFTTANLCLGAVEAVYDKKTVDVWDGYGPLVIQFNQFCRVTIEPRAVEDKLFCKK